MGRMTHPTYGHRSHIPWHGSLDSSVDLFGHEPPTPITPLNTYENGFSFQRCDVPHRPSIRFKDSTSFGTAWLMMTAISAWRRGRGFDGFGGGLSWPLSGLIQVTTSLNSGLLLMPLGLRLIIAVKAPGRPPRRMSSFGR